MMHQISRVGKRTAKCRIKNAGLENEGPTRSKNRPTWLENDAPNFQGRKKTLQNAGSKMQGWTMQQNW